MTIQLYIHRDGQQFGPYTIAVTQKHLRDGTLAPSDLAWYEGAADWMPLSTIPGISAVATRPPPPPRTMPPLTPGLAAVSTVPVAELEDVSQEIQRFSQKPTNKNINTQQQAMPPAAPSVQAIPKLWNPNAAANWSLLFTPILGAWLHAKNWKELDQPDKSQKSMIWVYVGFVFLIVVLFLPDNVGSGPGLIFILAWYFSSAKGQVKYLKENNIIYNKKTWGKPLLLGLGGLVAYFVIAIAIISSTEPSISEVLEAESVSLVTQIVKEQLGGTATCINSGSQNGSNTQRENVKEGDSKFGDTTHKIEKTTNGDLENQDKDGLVAENARLQSKLDELNKASIRGDSSSQVEGHQTIRDPEPRKNYANVYWKSKYTLFDLISDEPIFPVKKGGQTVYLIYYSSEEDPNPYFGEFTPQRLEGHLYYKFINKATCVKFCESRKKVPVESEHVSQRRLEEINALAARLVVGGQEQVQKQKILNSLEGIVLPCNLIVTEGVSLLNSKGGEAFISSGSTIRVLSRKKLGSLEILFNGVTHVGNESRLAGKVKLQ